MSKCEIGSCGIEARHIIKIKKSEEDDKVFKVCQGHCESYKEDCKREGWEFLEVR